MLGVDSLDGFRIVEVAKADQHRQAVRLNLDDRRVAHEFVKLTLAIAVWRQVAEAIPEVPKQRAAPRLGRMSSRPIMRQQNKQRAALGQIDRERLAAYADRP